MRLSFAGKGACTLDRDEGACTLDTRASDRLGDTTAAPGYGTTPLSRGGSAGLLIRVNQGNKSPRQRGRGPGKGTRTPPTMRGLGCGPRPSMKFILLLGKEQSPSGALRARWAREVAPREEEGSLCHFLAGPGFWQKNHEIRAALSIVHHSMWPFLTNTSNCPTPRPERKTGTLLRAGIPHIGSIKGPSTRCRPGRLNQGEVRLERAAGTQWGRTWDSCCEKAPHEALGAPKTTLHTYATLYLDGGLYHSAVGPTPGPER
jgi:hypothetical protein